MEFFFALGGILTIFVAIGTAYEWYKNRQFRKNCEKHSSENYVRYDDEYL